jgi:ketosteroid isomerase-like protein
VPDPDHGIDALREEVLDAAHARAAALAGGDAVALSRLLHPEFRWTSHTGEHFDREAYVASNAGGSNRWSTQELRDVVVLVDGDTAVLRCEAHDVVDRGRGAEEFRMPMTLVWVRRRGGWVCLAGHAGPRRTGRRATNTL